MSLFVEQIATHGRIQLLRHLRSPAIWWLALAAPIGARFLVPETTANYSVLAINDAIPALDSGVLGLQLGIVMAVILLPIAYIFLRAGPTRKTPWQAETVTPARRSALGLGHWIADTLALWVLMLALAGAGVMLAYFRLPAAEVNPFEIVLALCLIAAPALSLVAAIRTVFTMRPWLRKAGGDVLFFFLWVFLISISAAFFASSGVGGSPFADVIGLAAPLLNATDFPIETFNIGFGEASFEKVIQIDAMAGVTDSGFLLSRLFWIVIAAGLVFLSGLVFKPTRRRWSAPTPNLDRGPALFSDTAVRPVTPKPHGHAALLTSEWSQILRPRLLIGLLGAAALAGFVLPFRGMVGPAVAVLLIFPMTQHGARWRGAEMSRLTDLSPTSAMSQLGIRLAASSLLALGLCLPALLRMLAKAEFSYISDIFLIGLGLPLLAIGLSHVTRGPVAGRLVLLILWYGYLNLGP